MIGVTIVTNKQRKAATIVSPLFFLLFFSFLLPLLIYTYLSIYVQKNLLEKGGKEEKKKNGGQTST